MHTIGYVVLPQTLPIIEENVQGYIKQQVAKYSSNYEVKPYKQFFTEEETRRYAANHGFIDLNEYNLYLQQKDPETGIENGLLYWITTYNPERQYDYYSLLFYETKKGILLANRQPFHIITPDGVWHSAFDYGYKPILDFEINGLHPDNESSQKQWQGYFQKVLKKYVRGSGCSLLKCYERK